MSYRSFYKKVLGEKIKESSINEKKSKKSRWYYRKRNSIR